MVIYSCKADGAHYSAAQASGAAAQVLPTLSRYIAMQTNFAHSSQRLCRQASCFLAACTLALVAHASDKKPDPKDKEPVKADIEVTTASNPKDVANKVRDALGTNVLPNKKLVVNVNSAKRGAGGSGGAAAAHLQEAPAASPAAGTTNRRNYAARAAAVTGHTPATRIDTLPLPGQPSTNTMASAHGHEAHWAYEGETGPQAWGKLKPDFNLCAIGKRQSPINIEDGNTLQGPAEPIAFSYTPSNGTVVNNGHTIQVDVQGDNTITVRGSTYRLLQFHFHTPSEEQINYKRFPMVAHLVHKNNEGELAVVAVLLQEGEANAMLDKVWTYMPLDASDRVRMPQGLLDVNGLLPKDQRYYQFMGSLTTPPCSEGVLWMVLKQPLTISRAQYKLFTQLYPNNARPVQPANGRAVREAL